jgi:hypothetical protein
VYTQEIGRLRVTDVKERVSVAQVVGSCEAILLGDLLLPAPQRIAPVKRQETTFDRFRDPNGKQTGRLVLARDGREVLSSNQVVFIDLGAEDNVKQGDHFTVYRPAGTGNITRFRDKEEITAASGGFESDRFKGGKFSNQAQRVKDPTNSSIYGPYAGRETPPPACSAQSRRRTRHHRRTATHRHRRHHARRAGSPTGDFVELQ